MTCKLLIVWNSHRLKRLRSAILLVKGITLGEIALSKKSVLAVNKSAGTSGMTIVRVQVSLAA